MLAVCGDKCGLGEGPGNAGRTYSESMVDDGGIAEGVRCEDISGDAEKDSKVNEGSVPGVDDDKNALAWP